MDYEADGGMAGQSRSRTEVGKNGYCENVAGMWSRYVRSLIEIIDDFSWV